MDRRLEQLAALAFAAADVLFEVDRALRVRHVGGAIQKLTGHGATAIRNLSLFELIVPADRVFLRRVVEAFNQDKTVERITVRFLQGAENTVPAILGITSMPGADSERLVTATILDRGFIACPDSDGFLDRSAFIDLARRMTPPTGEPTRFKVVMLALPQLVRNAALRSTMLGTAFLAEVEAILRISSEGGVVTRLSDDAFAYLQPIGDDSKVVESKIEAATDALLAKPCIRSLPLDASLLEQSEVEAALNYALENFAGEQTRDKIVLENLPDCLAASTNRNRNLVTSCRNIIESGTFFQVLQPIMALKTGAIQHYEVLTRFAEGVTRGISNTGEFIEIAEQIGMINTFDLINCVKTIKLLQTLPAGIRLALNVSGRSVQSAEFSTRLMNMLEAPEMQVAPSRLLIEITETRGITDFEGPTALLQHLVKRGHRICLDDFGAGAMSFEYLRRFPVNYVKIDGPFFRNAMVSSRDRILIRAIARCSFELGCRTVVEMIETEAQAALARELGVECGQGWLFGKPMTVDALFASLKLSPPKPAGRSRSTVRRAAPARPTEHTEVSRAAVQPSPAKVAIPGNAV